MSEVTSQAEIGRRMKEAADAAGLDPYEVARALGVRPPTVYRWYKGLSRPANRFMDEFGRLVCRPASYLWSGVEEIEHLLLRWAELARAEVSGSEALRRIKGDYGNLTDEQREVLDDAAAPMLKFLSQIAGQDWSGLPVEAQEETFRQLVRLLKEWRRERDNGAAP